MCLIVVYERLKPVNSSIIRQEGNYFIYVNVEELKDEHLHKYGILLQCVAQGCS